MESIIKKGRTFILAEMAQSYEGSLETLLKVSQGVCDAGADGVMFQVVYADELAVREYAHFKLFESLEMPDANWKEVIDLIHKNGKLAFGEIFGLRSASLMKSLGIDGFKVHAADLSNLSLLKKLAEYCLPILLSVGGAYANEIKAAIDVVKKNGAREVVLLHGYQRCPTVVPDTHLLKIRAIQDEYGLPVGYSDHIAGCREDVIENVNELAFYLPLVALGAGAKLIEKHVMLDRTKKWEDYESALTPIEYSRFVNLVREMESSTGEEDLVCNKAEEDYRMAAKKFIVASDSISKDTIITENHICFKRIANPESGLTNSSEVVGKKLLSGLQKNETIRNDIIE